MAKLQTYKCVEVHEGLNSTVKIQPELNEYAFFHSYAFKDIFDHLQKESDLYTIGGYLKLTNGKRKLYLKYHQLSGTRGDEIRLSYANRALLDIKEGNQAIKVQKAKWFAYNWYNRDVDKRWSFRTSVIAAAALLLIEIPSLILTIIKF